MRRYFRILRKGPWPSGKYTYPIRAILKMHPTATLFVLVLVIELETRSYGHLQSLAGQSRKTLFHPPRGDAVFISTRNPAYVRNACIDLFDYDNEHEHEHEKHVIVFLKFLKWTTSGSHPWTKWTLWTIWPHKAFHRSGEVHLVHNAHLVHGLVEGAAANGQFQAQVFDSC